MRFLAHIDETEDEIGTLIDVAISLMASGLAPVAGQLTRMPAGSLHPGMNAGPSFQFFRSTALLPHKQSAWRVFHERLLLAADSERLAGELSSEPLKQAAAVLRDCAEKLSANPGSSA